MTCCICKCEKKITYQFSFSKDVVLFPMCEECCPNIETYLNVLKKIMNTTLVNMGMEGSVK